MKACRSLGVDFVVSGGRHSTSGASSIENGAVIDMRLMNKVAVDPEANTVMAEGGALWADLDEEAAKHNLCAVGGKLLTFHVLGLAPMFQALSTTLGLLGLRLAAVSDG